jgi:hypothetical protein
MTGTQGSQVTTRGDIQPTAWDLATVSGALSEIATTWRRAQAGRPDLPPGLPQRLADTALHLAADARLLAGTGQGKAPGMPASLAGQMSALRHDVAAARAMTHGPGDPGVGDAALWESIGPALSS